VPELRRRLAPTASRWRRSARTCATSCCCQRLRDREVEAAGARERPGHRAVPARQQQGGGDAAQVELNLAQVLVAVPENAIRPQVQALRAKADACCGARAPARTSPKLARENSDAPGAATNGGQFGLRRPTATRSCSSTRCRACPKAASATVVRSGAGFHVIKVVERRQAGMPGATVTQSHARHILLRTDARS
jgi:peptidyl-prolyl cis-trans isomerase SurA